MNEGGNHGGSDTGETEAALVLASPKFRTMRVKNTHECPNLPANGTIFDYYRKVEQQDLVSTLSALLGLPIPRNSIGTLLSELRGMWPDEESYVHVLARNAQQLWRISQTVFDPSAARKEEMSWSTVAQNRTLPTNACPIINNTVEKLSCLLTSAEQQALQSSTTQQWTSTAIAYEEFLAQAQQALISENRSFNLARMATGIGLCTVAMIVCWYSIGTCWPSRTTAITCAGVALAYGLALFTSNSEKSERYFWYLATPAWIVFLAVRAMNRTQDRLVRDCISWAVIRIVTLHCIATCWSFLGSWIEAIQFADHKALK
jgi:ethanolaminephosphotransferase